MPVRDRQGVVHNYYPSPGYEGDGVFLFCSGLRHDVPRRPMPSPVTCIACITGLDLRAYRKREP